MLIAVLWYNSQQQRQIGIIQSLSERPEEEAPSGIEAEQAYNKGMEYYESENYNSAFPLLRQAAEAGNTEAMNNLGIMYVDVKKDYNEALHWLRKAASPGHPRAEDLLKELGVSTTSK